MEQNLTSSGKETAWCPSATSTHQKLPQLGHLCSVGCCRACTSSRLLRSPALVWVEGAHLPPCSPWSGGAGRESATFFLNAEVFRQLGLWQTILMKSSCLLPINRILYAAFYPNRVKSEDKNFIYIYINKKTYSLKSKLY